MLWPQSHDRQHRERDSDGGKRMIRGLVLLLLLWPVTERAQADVVFYHSKTPDGQRFVTLALGKDEATARANGDALFCTEPRVCRARLHCSNRGWYALVRDNLLTKGDAGRFNEGFTCGFHTRAAALRRAYRECLHYGGDSCCFVNSGYDDDSAALVGDTLEPGTSMAGMDVEEGFECPDPSLRETKAPRD